MLLGVKVSPDMSSCYIQTFIEQLCSLQMYTPPAIPVFIAYLNYTWKESGVVMVIDIEVCYDSSGCYIQTFTERLRFLRIYPHPTNQSYASNTLHLFQR